ncbi:methylated-DNA--[protein]-cysteine S-methyltransferase [Neisseria sp. Ec49-e6-T10]|uniref:methylated-DNA--[protein]-cysteine S-methyltransferase n=1 Tax=Neisseria sp. Ec49-e6-T10 TaxID=3140744 RepID=UPI003EBD4A2D
MKQVTYGTYQAPFGLIQLQFQDEILSGLELKTYEPLSYQFSMAEQKYIHALDAYFSGKLEKFTLPLFLDGTTFQKKVWTQIAQIDYGLTKNYGQLAELTGSHARAIGQACGHNPIPIFIPCHRVLGKTGLGGFSLGQDKDMLDIKVFLLQLEGVLCL